MVAVSITCAITVTEAVVSTHRTRRAWSADVPVLVAAADIDKGEELTLANSRVRRMPRALVPSDVVSSLPADSTSRVSLRANTLLTLSVLVPDAESVAVPTGWRVVALPDDIVPPDLTPGDRVDIVIGTSVAAIDCIVLGITPLAVAVPPDAVPAVAAGARLGDISVVARP